jgi:hypothetical protein
LPSAIIGCCGAEDTKTLASAQLISAEQLWQHAEQLAYVVLDIWGFGLAAAVEKPAKQVSRLAKLSAGIHRDKSVSPGYEFFYGLLIHKNIRSAPIDILKIL